MQIAKALNPTTPRGTSVVEVVVAMAMIAVALMALLTAIISSMTTVEANRQEAIVLTSVREKISEMQAVAATTDFATIYNSYNGQKFNIGGLGETSADLGGDVTCYVNETENIPQLGLPCDLNGNGSADTDASSNYKLLPVCVRVRWQVPKGGETLTINGTNYDNVVTLNFYLVLTQYRY